MINKIRIQNFKCLRDVQVELGPFNVLIGPNDSGKTSFLEAMRLLGKTTTTYWGGEPLSSPLFGKPSELVWQNQKELSICFTVQGTSFQAFEYRLSLPANGSASFGEQLSIDGVGQFAQQGEAVKYSKWTLGGGTRQHTFLSYFANAEKTEAADFHPALDVAQTLNSSELYQFNPKEMRSHAKAEVNPSLNTSGSNLATNLVSLWTGPNRDCVLSIERRLNEAIPTLKGISTPLANSNEGRHEIKFALSENSAPSISIPSTQVSDGAMLVVGYLVLAYGNTPQILLIEEPENGLHPSLLKMVIELLRKISTGKTGNQPRQVILTTHNPLLLNYVAPEEVRIFQRDESGATRVTPMNKVPNIDRLSKDFAPGDLWSLFGEEDLVKGEAR